MPEDGPLTSTMYRRKAAEMRQRAEEATSEDMRGFCMMMAAEFDRLADEADGLQ